MWYLIVVAGMGMVSITPIEGKGQAGYDRCKRLEHATQVAYKHAGRIGIETMCFNNLTGKDYQR